MSLILPSPVPSQPQLTGPNSGKFPRDAAERRAPGSPSPLANGTPVMQSPKISPWLSLKRVVPPPRMSAGSFGARQHSPLAAEQCWLLWFVSFVLLPNKPACFYLPWITPRSHPSSPRSHPSSPWSCWGCPCY